MMRLPPAVPRVLLPFRVTTKMWADQRASCAPKAAPAPPVIERDRMMMAMLVVGHRNRANLPTREIIAPPCAAGSRQTRPRVGDDVSALARLNIDFAGASFDNARRPQPCCSKVYSSAATVPTSIYKVCRRRYASMGVIKFFTDCSILYRRPVGPPARIFCEDRANTVSEDRAHTVAED